MPIMNIDYEKMYEDLVKEISKARDTAKSDYDVPFCDDEYYASCSGAENACDELLYKVAEQRKNIHEYLKN